MHRNGACCPGTVRLTKAGYCAAVRGAEGKAMTAHGFLLRAARGARTITAISAAGAALSFAAMAAPAAHAATGQARPAATRTAAAHQNIPAVIGCKIFVVIRFPHPLDATGKLTCSGGVRRITIRVTIYRGTRAVRSQAFTRVNTRSLKRTVYTSCVSGRYHAVALGKVRTKSGHVLSGSAKTRTVRVTC